MGTMPNHVSSERRGPGRRRSSSRASIEDAAGELFVENTYAGTTIEQITQRAGVSRASFFNYFAAKSDLLWGDVDLLVNGVTERLAAQPVGLAPLEGVRRALVEAAADAGADRIPLAVVQWEVMGARDDLLTAGLPRFARLADIVRRHLDTRCEEFDAAATSAAAFAIVGALVAAAASWAAAGIGRGSLAGPLDAAITPVCEGFAVRIR
jgi:AcrR family transcriptional regulator